MCHQAVMTSAGAGAHLAGEGDPGAVEGHQEVVDHDGDVVGGQQQHQHHLVLARVAQLAEDRVQGGRRQRRLGVQRGRGRVEAHLVHAATCATCDACPLCPNHWVVFLVSSGAIASSVGSSLGHITVSQLQMVAATPRARTFVTST